MNASLLLYRIGGRFHPATRQQFSGYARHLRWMTRSHDVESREALARLYGYRNVYELAQALRTPGTPGPFDDAIPLDILGTEQIQSAISVRNEWAMQIIANRLSTDLGGGQSKFTLLQLSALALFSSPLAHYAAFRALADPRSSVLVAHFLPAH